MKYVAMTKLGAIPVAARVTNAKAKILTAGAWHYCTKAKYRSIRAETKRIKEGRRLSKEKEAQAVMPGRPKLTLIGAAVKKATLH